MEPIRLTCGVAGPEISRGSPWDEGRIRNHAKSTTMLSWREIDAFSHWLEVNQVPLQYTTLFARRQMEFCSRVSRACELMSSLGCLYDYQQAGVDFLVHSPAAILADDMGLGKTVQALIACADTPTIIQCPVALAGVWVAEARRWRPDKPVTILENKEEFVFPCGNTILIVPYGRAPDAIKKSKKFECQPCTTIIADESHYIKNGRAKRTFGFRRLAHKVRIAGGSVWLLTGTPLLNTPKELWTLLQNLKLGSAIFEEFQKFAVFFGGEQSAIGRYEFHPARVRKEGLDRIRPFFLRRTKQDMLSLPPKSTHYTEIDSLEDYDTTLLDCAYEEVRGLLGADQLDQISAPGVMQQARAHLAIAKLPTAIEMITSHEESGEPLIVFSMHKAPVKKIGERDGWAAITGETPPELREQIVQDFQDGLLSGVAMTIKSGGVGFTLTRAAAAIFIDQSYVPGDNLQAQDRLLRIGQHRPVSIYNLVANHPLDRAVAAAILRKEQLIAATTQEMESK